MDKEAVYIYTMEYYSAIRRNESESDLGRWMNPEPVKQRVMQKEKNKYRILMHIYIVSRKMVLMSLFTGQQWRRRYSEQTYGHWAGVRKERVGYIQRRTWKHTLPYIK